MIVCSWADPKWSRYSAPCKMIDSNSALTLATRPSRLSVESDWLPGQADGSTDAFTSAPTDTQTHAYRRIQTYITRIHWWIASSNAFHLTFVDAPRFTRDSSDILVGISPDYFSMLLFISSFFFLAFGILFEFHWFVWLIIWIWFSQPLQMLTYPITIHF